MPQPTKTSQPARFRDDECEKRLYRAQEYKSGHDFVSAHLLVRDRKNYREIVLQ
jgi:hypothetical protein